MALTGPFDRLRQLQREMATLARTGSAAQQTIARPVAKRLQGQIKQQFQTGTGPDNRLHQRRADGKLALVSRRLAVAVKVAVVPGGVAGAAPRPPWLEAHQEGHVFPARRSAGQRLTFNARGRLLSRRRARRAKLVFDVRSRAHAIGQRVLPQRRIRPDAGALTEPWAKAVNEGALEGMRAWYERAGR